MTLFLLKMCWFTDKTSGKTVKYGYIETIALFFPLTFIVVLTITLVARHFRSNRETVIINKIVIVI